MVLAAALLGAAAVPALAQPAGGDVAAGRAKAQSCAVCHGVLGVSVTPDAPNLAGQPALYVAAQLKAYRDGGRRHEVMTLMAKPLSDADIQALAAWYASLKIEVKPPN